MDNSRLYFSDEGILSSGGKITANDAARLGRAASFLSGGIVVGIKASPYSEMLAMSFCAAALESGADIFFSGDISLPELFFMSKQAVGDCVVVYISSVFYPSFRFFRRGGGELSPAEEKLLEEKLFKNEEKSGRVGKFSDISSLRCLYASHMKGLANFGDGRFPYSVVINSPSERIRTLCSEVLPQFDGGETLAFHLNEDGVKVTAFTESTGYIQCGKLLMLALKYRLEAFKTFEDINGKIFKLPMRFPGFAERIAGEYEVKLERSDTAELDFYNDKIILIVEILKIIQKTGRRLDDLCRSLPEYAELDRYVPVEKESCEERIKNFCSQYKNGKNYALDKDFSGGIAINDGLGKIFITPIHSGKGIMLHAESREMEAASELCDFYENILRGKGSFREKV